MDIKGLKKKPHNIKNRHTDTNTRKQGQSGLRDKHTLVNQFNNRLRMLISQVPMMSYNAHLPSAGIKSVSLTLFVI